MYGSDKEALEALNNKHKALLSEIGNVIVGQEQVIREVTTAIFAGGHVLSGGSAGTRQNTAREHHCPILGLELQPRAIHTGLDAIGYCRFRDPR